MAHIVPDNFVGAFARGELLQVVVLAVMVGVGILAIPQAAPRINHGLTRSPRCCSRSSTW